MFSTQYQPTGEQLCLQIIVIAHILITGSLSHEVDCTVSFFDCIHSRLKQPTGAVELLPGVEWAHKQNPNALTERGERRNIKYVVFITTANQKTKGKRHTSIPQNSPPSTGSEIEEISTGSEISKIS